MPPTACGCSRRRCKAADEPGFAARRAASEAAGKRRGLGLLLPSARHRRHRRRACRGRRSSPTGWSRERRHAEPGPGPRDGVRADPGGVARRAGRAHRDPPGRHAHHPARRRHRRLVLDHHQRHDAEARRRRGDPARPRPRRRAPGDGAGRHRLPRRRLRDRRHRPAHRPVRAGGPEAVRGRRAVRRQDRSPSRPASWSARSRSIPRPARCASTA